MLTALLAQWRKLQASHEECGRNPILDVEPKPMTLAARWALRGEQVKECADELEAALAAAPSLLTTAQREALAAIVEQPQSYQQWERLDYLLDSVMGEHHATKAHWLLAADARLRGAA